MDTTTRIAKNTGVIFLSQLVILGFSLAFNVILVRYLGVYDYGIYAFAMAYIGLFTIIAHLGLATLLIRETARDKEVLDLYFGNSLILEIIFSAVAFFLIVTGLAIMGRPLETCYVVCTLAVGFVCIDSIANLPSAVFTAYEVRVYEAGTNLIGRGAYMALGALGIFLNLPLLQICLLLILSYVLKLVFSYQVMVRKIHRPTFTVRPNLWLIMIQASVPLALVGLFFGFYNNIDMTMLNYIQGEEAVGLYAVAYQFINFLWTFPIAFIGSIWPIMARFHIESSDALRFLLERSVKVFITLGIPLAFGMSILADDIVVGLFGIDLIDSVIALQILIWGGTLLFMSYTSISTLAAIDRTDLAIRDLLICAVFHVALNLWLISQYSYVGAAISTLLTNVALFSMYYYHLAQNGLRVQYLRYVFKPLVASILMGAIVWTLKINLSDLTPLSRLSILMPCAITLFLFAIYLLKVPDDWDIHVIRKLLQSRQI